MFNHLLLVNLFFGLNNCEIAVNTEPQQISTISRQPETCVHKSTMKSVQYFSLYGATHLNWPVEYFSICFAEIMTGTKCNCVELFICYVMFLFEVRYNYFYSMSKLKLKCQKLFLSSSTIVGGQ